MPKVLWFSTKGTGSNDAIRIDTLLGEFADRREVPFSKQGKLGGLKEILGTLAREKPDVLVMEGTGIAGGLACLLGRLLHRVPYVVSSGDAVGPFIRSHHPATGLLFEIYERLLCGLSAGFIGWTPYLCGRAMTFGSPRAVTAPGWPLGGEGAPAEETEGRRKVRAQYGISADAIVVGIVGALEWNEKKQYCYGLDLVECALRVRRDDVAFLIVGGGSGLERLRARAGDLLGRKVFLPGPVPLAEVMEVTRSFDVAALPQSMDGVGMFRYTTKIAEYLAARLPVITSQIPMAYDLGEGWMWRLPGEGPWDEVYLTAQARLVEGLQPAVIEELRARIPRNLPEFSRDDQVRRVTSFIKELCASRNQSAAESST